MGHDTIAVDYDFCTHYRQLVLGEVPGFWLENVKNSTSAFFAQHDLDFGALRSAFIMQGLLNIYTK